MLSGLTLQKTLLSFLQIFDLLVLFNISSHYVRQFFPNRPGKFCLFYLEEDSLLVFSPSFFALRRVSLAHFLGGSKSKRSDA